MIWYVWIWYNIWIYTCMYMSDMAFCRMQRCWLKSPQSSETSAWPRSEVGPTSLNFPRYPEKIAVFPFFPRLWRSSYCMETTKMICLYLFKPFFNVSWIILKFSCCESQPENTSSSDQVGSFGNADRSAAARRHLYQTQKLCRGSMFVRHSLSFHAWMWIPCSSTTCVRSRRRTSWHLK